MLFDKLGLVLYQLKEKNILSKRLKKTPINCFFLELYHSLCVNDASFLQSFIDVIKVLIAGLDPEHELIFQRAGWNQRQFDHPLNNYL